MINKKKIMMDLFTDTKVLVAAFVYLFVMIVAITYKPQIVNNTVVYANNVVLGVNNTVNIDNETNDIIEESIIEEVKEEVKYNKNDIREKSNLTEEAINKYLSGTPINGIGEALLKYEEEYNVNSIFALSLIIQQSDFGRSETATEYNNLTNLGVSSGDPYSYNSIDESIKDIYELISNDYLDEDGTYFLGYSLDDISINYCNGSDAWVNEINDIVNDILININI